MPGQFLTRLHKMVRTQKKGEKKKKRKREQHIYLKKLI